MKKFIQKLFFQHDFDSNGILYDRESAYIRAAFEYAIRNPMLSEHETRHSPEARYAVVQLAIQPRTSPSAIIAFEARMQRETDISPIEQCHEEIANQIGNACHYRSFCGINRDHNTSAVSLPFQNGYIHIAFAALYEPQTTEHCANEQAAITLLMIVLAFQHIIPNDIIFNHQVQLFYDHIHRDHQIRTCSRCHAILDRDSNISTTDMYRFHRWQSRQGETFRTSRHLHLLEQI